MKSNAPEFDQVRFTLVDCPGHGSLIKTVIGGACIIDMMILVIDITKGVQAQTKECLVIGEVINTHLLVVLNKVDQLPEKSRDEKVKKMTKLVKEKILSKIQFKTAEIVPCSAFSGKTEKVVEFFENFKYFPDRTSLLEKPFLMSIDHCFQIKGSGSVFTGTVLAGKAAVGENVEVVGLGEEKRIKSIQIFKEAKNEAVCGDRAAICVSNFDAKKLERGLLAFPKSIKGISHVMVKLNKVKLYQDAIESGQKFHVTCGHQLANAKITLMKDRKGEKVDLSEESFFEGKIFDFVDKFEQEDESILASLEFDRPIYFLPNGLLIGSRLELDANTTDKCRIAFSAFLEPLSTKNPKELVVVKEKSKTGTVERLHDDNTLIVKDLFKKETNLDLFNRLKVSLSTGESAIIDGTFGTSGKIKIYNSDGFAEETKERCRKPKKGENLGKREAIEVKLVFFKNVNSDDKHCILQL
ncbi:Oidioi.mRNA.OKI2018_I69.chr1.g1258.t1.cds [Oikopleura dioica]|uniref:Oidioi.mRNA.OKI2018_I69.chr1.g1258.t1.cds n=1 Tax=Oikopleura dioica TaxID=34765 RepID=A0ABN7SQX6_OIKDI|nr:Oidioi.mRNA.OKI2018_I69.chr1.g1258.t1.cds [Oikopleura dioica]